ncbi:nuclear transport factor 2 family protein [Nocardioides hwasunensis]|uniref:Nuclear transport factor 2 family protein n=1 Tax=Nocardioides hwasunensis TaxID=397258 RepID=A0ABR8MMU5_9ACTN|nr:nuclear transport factor 2 family protein [Nocardioides hwasunensis]MBD3915409.1 nuclear transport factor 2 family protein [Nocardioides hwasunensis]
MSASQRSIALVEAFLADIGAGRHSVAQASLADDAELVFPGGRRYRSLAELAAGSRSRYRRVDKHRDVYEATEDGSLVWSIGRLHGENLHGVVFDGVRYVDRFRLRDGLIVEQWVWNDLAESGVLDARTHDELAQEWRA